MGCPGAIKTCRAVDGIESRIGAVSLKPLRTMVAIPVHSVVERGPTGTGIFVKPPFGPNV